MTRRIVMGNDGGTFKFRASRAGVNAATAPLGDGYQVHEDMTPMAATENGSVVISSNSSTTFTLGQTYNDPPMVLLNAGDGQVMGTLIRAEFNLTNNTLKIFNDHSASLTIRWAVLADYFL